MDRRDLLKRLAVAGLAIPTGLLIEKTLVPDLQPKPLDVTLRATTAHLHYQPMVHPAFVAQTGPGMIYGVRLLTSPPSGHDHTYVPGNFFALKSGNSTDEISLDYMTYVEPRSSETGWLIEIFPA